MRISDWSSDVCSSDPNKQYRELRIAHHEQGKAEALGWAKTLLDSVESISVSDRERLFAYLAGTRKQILLEPQVLLTEASRLPGLDGQKMSKSYGNSIDRKSSV